MTHPRAFVAIRPEEFDRLFDAATAAELERLTSLDRAVGAGKVELPEDVADRYDVLITSWSTQRFPPEQLQGDRLQLAVHAAGSVRGLFSRDSLGGRLRLAQGGADAMAVAVAELSVTLALVLLRNVHTHDRGLQTTRDWVAGGRGMLGRSVHEQRVGIVGLSRVGRSAARMMAGLGVTRMSAYDPYAAPESAPGIALVDLDELCRTSDVLLVCAPVTAETRGLLGAEQFAALPDGAVLINAGRSAVTDEAALVQELLTGRISAGLDVFDTEPLPTDSPLFGRDNVVLTPHVAGGTTWSRHEQGRVVVAEVGRFLRGERLAHEVTTANYDQLA
ncbi:MAG TPA: hydroxyacid dehydrogenase [Candidatus Ruania gallistercoris]|uniref:Hydroxyacid dehydrogenase n=1 Tax=Candidatus Ruania gallistercoris TaxID=2838746 RepID=A0A9D2J459_9MICO|nr:hydroxyacid dehydrogenase [Candidatus Ruania gallistercoris]